ncbi:DUF4129 domain-containing protein [Compostibacter hankyongensis]|uniref:DUF4129 domain-containing protein n=1 Tax=Compostibacter hankyongensis TaxID=1007089 RepID=A0ABP8FF31_9BACT
MRWLPFLYLLCLSPAVNGRQHALRYDSSRVERRQVSPAQLQKYRQQREFRYDRQDRSAYASLWSRLWDWLWERYFDLFGRSGGGLLLRILLWGLCIGVLGYFLFRVLGMNAILLLGKKNREEALPYVVGEEDINAPGFEAALAAAIAQKQYRLAVRLLYLQCLKQLNDRAMIRWQPGKTNRHYLQELSGTTAAPLFGELTRSYEYAWYGEMPVAPRQFEDIRNRFEQFRTMVDRPEAEAGGDK